MRFIRLVLDYYSWPTFVANRIYIIIINSLSINGLLPKRAVITSECLPAFDVATVYSNLVSLSRCCGGTLRVVALSNTGL